MSDGDTPYVVPLNFGYEYDEGKGLTLYFHCATEGRKLDIMRKNPKVCFEMDCSHKLVSADEACGYTMEFESVIGEGEVIIQESNDDKVAALKLVMEKYAPGGDFSFPEAALNMIVTLKLTVSDFSGKRNIIVSAG
jgi:nitroimidazol reductase NimA-like FMN-containing flavoprotein (pyridoxamine 5'-phosphate oxidase superfamily)